MKNGKRLLCLTLALAMVCSLAVSAAAAEPDRSGTIGQSDVLWDLDSDGHLTISGSGDTQPFDSPEDQPWALFRDQITQVWFDGMEEDLAVTDLSYWFAGCENLDMAEIPSSVRNIGTDAFAGCSSLRVLQLYYQNDTPFSIEPGAFALDLEDGEEPLLTEVWMSTTQGTALKVILDYDWLSDGRTVSVYDLYSVQELAFCYEGGDAHLAGGTPIYTEDGYWDTCIYCGIILGFHSYDDSDDDDDDEGSGTGQSQDTCSHDSSHIVYSPYDETRHSYSRICDECGEVIETGRESHVWGAAETEEYDSSTHKVTRSCTRCSYEDVSYEDHTDEDGDGICDECGSRMSATLTWDLGDGTSVTTTQPYDENLILPETPVRDGYLFQGWFTAEEGGEEVTSSTLFTEDSPDHYYAQWEEEDFCSHDSSHIVYSPYDENQHSYSRICDECGEVLETGTEDHVWGSAETEEYDSSTHKVTRSCTRCSYEDVSYEEHTDGNGDGGCDECGRRMSTTLTWDLGDGTYVTTTQPYDENLILPDTPARDGYLFQGWFTAEEGGEEVTSSTLFTEESPDHYYAQWEEIVIFSVTVPAVLPLAMAEDGQVYTAEVSLENRSTADVKVSGIMITAQDGWTLVPYETDMSSQKVNSHLIGFSLNGLETTVSGSEQIFTLDEGWLIGMGDDLSLDYHAVLSALSSPVTEESVLSVAFVLEWA